MKTKSKLKRTFILSVSLMLCFLMAIPLLTGCGGEKNILVVSRENGSGTREAFESYVGVSSSEVKSDEEYKETSNVTTKVASVKSAIGYISVASVDDSIKVLTVEGVEPTAENVRNGAYGIQRPFLLLTSSNVPLSPAAQDFFNYCMSKTASEGIAAHNGITTTDFANRPEYTAPTSALSGSVVLKGSTSMELMIKQLVADYQELCGSKVSGVSFSFEFPGSSGGRTAVSDDTTGNVIGLASSAKANDKYIEHILCLDAVAIIVNKSNDYVDNITKEQLKSIYTKQTIKFSEVK